MPLYEYVCTKCSKEFEELILKEGEQVSCPACGDKQTKKLLSRCRAKFAGGGDPGEIPGSSSSGGSCSSCSGGSCASCG